MCSNFYTLRLQHVVPWEYATCHVTHNFNTRKITFLLSTQLTYSTAWTVNVFHPFISAHLRVYIAHLRQQCHNSKFVIYQEKLLKVLKCYNFLWVQRRHNCSPAASFANCVMILYLLKMHLKTFLSIPITQKCQILSCDTLVTNERYIYIFFFSPWRYTTHSGCVYFTALYRALASSRTRLLDQTQRRVTVGRTPLNEWSVRLTDLYLTTHNTHNRQTSMPRVGFEPTIAAGERP